MVKRGDLFYADLTPVKGSEQGGIRPVLVVQNNIGNHFAPTVIVVAISSKRPKKELPTHVEIKEPNEVIKEKSIILLEQIRTIDKSRLLKRIGTLNKENMDAVNSALAISVGIKIRSDT